MRSDFVSVCCLLLHYKFNNLAISRKNIGIKGTVFKPSFKCLKNKKINFSPAILKLETLPYQKIYIISSYIIFAERFWFKKKGGLREKKHAKCRKLKTAHQNTFECKSIQLCLFDFLYWHFC
jgi:hypothetical protein